VFDTILGLPMHPLVVHATVVIVPSAALAVALAAVWPRFRRWAGFLPLLLSAAAVVLVPVSTSSGEALERRVQHTALLERHTQLADGLLLPVLILAVAAVALYWIQVKGPTGTAIMAVVILIAAVGSIGTLIQVARIGHSGAEAAWSTTAAATPTTRP
jgi:hypothetical protein